MASCKGAIALLIIIVHFDQKTTKLHRKFKWPFLWVNVSKLALRNVGFHAIDSGECSFLSFVSFAFLPFFPLLLDPFPKLGEVLKDTYSSLIIIFFIFLCMYVIGII